jgi:hypothetical protein
MTVKVQEAPSTAPFPQDSLCMRVTNHDYHAKKMVTFDVQFVPPCLVRWGSEPMQVPSAAVHCCTAVRKGTYSEAG